MEQLHLMFDVALRIMDIHINVLGFNFSLVQFAIWSVSSYLLLWFIFRLFH